MLVEGEQETWCVEAVNKEENFGHVVVVVFAVETAVVLHLESVAAWEEGEERELSL